MKVQHLWGMTWDDNRRSSKNLAFGFHLTTRTQVLRRIVWGWRFLRSLGFKLVGGVLPSRMEARNFGEVGVECSVCAKLLE